MNFIVNSGLFSVDVYNHCFTSGKLSFSQRSGLITLLYKHGVKLDTKNWRPISLLCTDYKMEKFGNQLSVWKSRQLSFRGCAMIANVLGLSIFWYQATIFDVPKTVIFRIDKLLFPFVWSKKRECMARSSITQSLADGSLGFC
jgi:hypothetical protein